MHWSFHKAFSVRFLDQKIFYPFFCYFSRLYPYIVEFGMSVKHRFLMTNSIVTYGLKLKPFCKPLKSCGKTHCSGIPHKHCCCVWQLFHLNICAFLDIWDKLTSVAGIDKWLVLCYRVRNAIKLTYSRRIFNQRFLEDWVIFIVFGQSSLQSLVHLNQLFFSCFTENFFKPLHPCLIFEIKTY